MEVALIDKNKIAKEIKKTRDAGAEILVVTMHWGIEYVLLENGVQRPCTIPCRSGSRLDYRKSSPRDSTHESGP